MIRVQFGTCRLLVQGHANQSAYGTDIVCAAVSVLVTTLIRMLLQIERVGQAHRVKFQAEPGHAGICCDDSLEARGAFYFVETGLRALADDYPEYVQIEQKKPCKRELFIKNGLTKRAENDGEKESRK